MGPHLSLKAPDSSQPDFGSSIDHPFPTTGDAFAPQASRTEPPVRPPRKLPAMTERQAGQTRPPDHPRPPPSHSPVASASPVGPEERTAGNDKRFLWLGSLARGSDGRD